MAEAKNIWSKFTDRIFKKKEQNLTTAFDQMNGIMNFINRFGYVMGLEFTDDWKVTGRTVFAALFNFVLPFLGFYTLHLTFPSSENIIIIGGYAFNITVWTKITFITLNHEQYMSVIRFIFKVLKSNSSGPRQRILLNMIKRINYHLQINISGFLGGVGFYSAFPCYDFIFNGNLTLVSPVLVPFANPKTVRGYLITTGFNIFIVSFCVTLCVAISCLFFVTVDAYDGMVSLIEDDFEMFDGMCKRKERGQVYETQFRNIMMELNDLASFSSYTNDLHGLISTVQVSTSYVVVVTCLGAFFVAGYISGIGASMSFYTEMLMYCYIGQLLDNANKRIVTVICNAKWYTYEVKYQKDMITAIYVAQNLQSICLANVFPLNFDTGLQITNNIYSIITFMISMFD